MFKSLSTIIILLTLTSVGFCEPDFSGLFGALVTASNTASSGNNEEKIGELRKQMTQVLYRLDRIENELGLKAFEQTLTAQDLVAKISGMQLDDRDEFLVKNAIHINPQRGINSDEWRVMKCYLAEDDRHRVLNVFYALKLHFNRIQERNEKLELKSWYKEQKKQLKANDQW